MVSLRGPDLSTGTLDPPSSMGPINGCVCVHACVRECVCVHACVRECVCVCMCVNVHAYVCGCVYVSMH